VRRELSQQLLRRQQLVLLHVRLALGHPGVLHSGMRELVLRMRLLPDRILPRGRLVQLDMHAVRLHQRDSLQLQQDQWVELLLLRPMSGGLSRLGRLVQLDVHAVRLDQRHAVQLCAGLRLDLLFLQWVPVRLLPIGQELQLDVYAMRLDQRDAGQLRARPDGQLLLHVWHDLSHGLARCLAVDELDLRGVRLDQRHAAELRAQLMGHRTSGPRTSNSRSTKVSSSVGWMRRTRTYQTILKRVPR
jgi:hypothetical protein